MKEELKSTKDKKGWLIPYLIGLDEIFFRRWDYWTRVCLDNEVPKEPIPFIHFQDPHAYPEQQVQKNIRKCLDYPREFSNSLEVFIDWILWGFGRGKEFPHIFPETDNYWYRTFNLGLFYVEPAEHWSTFASEYLGKNNRIGFFATPSSVTEMMTRMTFGGEPQHMHKAMSVCDPCVGTSVMLLHASNYSMNLYGVDISPLLVKICKVNAFTYVPWLAVKPQHLTIFDKPDQYFIENIDLPSGIRIPKCSNCSTKPQSFFMDVRTPHEISISESSLLTINKPTISTDLVKDGIKTNNLKCAHCEEGR